MASSASKTTAAVILAAGLGKRMKSNLPKVLHKLGDRYIVDYVIENVKAAGITNIVLVIGHKHELVEEKLADRGVKFAIQMPQLGTGHAVQMAVPYLGEFAGELLVLCGDMPLVSTRTIKSLLETRRNTGAAAVVLTVRLENPGSYGRIIRDNNDFLEAIVEYRDANEDIRQINEVNTGAYCFDYRALTAVLDELKADNAQSEYYLTDTISLLKGQGLKVAALETDDPNEGLGINSIEELTHIDTIIREHKQ
jgi:bifunctional UDP-N-acetylglucosamine pyrophosphorylase / glucosamine-1-phosphate N-acetyltransferase